MEIKINKYNLPDIDILYNYRENRKCLFWIPDRIYIVLGVSNRPEESLLINNVIKDNIEVLKRPSGGETVMLTPNTLVISTVKIRDDIALSDVIPKMTPKEFFNLNNSKIISALESLGVENLYHKGISDIAIKEKKILGSAIYRTKDKIFYQAVLNVNENPELFERYLKHPVKEPDYRKGRGHNDFVTSLHIEGYCFEMTEIVRRFDEIFKII